MHNDAQNLRTTFAEGGVEVRGEDELGPWRLRFALHSWGRGCALMPVLEGRVPSGLYFPLPPFKGFSTRVSLPGAFRVQRGIPESDCERNSGSFREPSV